MVVRILGEIPINFFITLCSRGISFYLGSNLRKRTMSRALNILHMLRREPGRFRLFNKKNADGH